MPYRVYVSGGSAGIACSMFLAEMVYDVSANIILDSVRARGRRLGHHHLHDQVLGVRHHHLRGALCPLPLGRALLGSCMRLYAPRLVYCRLS